MDTTTRARLGNWCYKVEKLGIVLWALICQMMIHQTLGRLSPEYGHLPIVTDQSGNKLSKQTGARAIDTGTPNTNLRRALAFLGQPTPPDDMDCVEDIVHLATVNWRRDSLNSRNL